jgi:hypothetical protein
MITDMRMRFVLCVTALSFVAGCSSEVDKCLNDEMKAWKATNEENRRYNKENEQYNKEVDAYNEEVRKHNDSLPPVDATYYKDGRKMIDIDKLFENTKKFREQKIKPVDERPIEVVEAELRRICMRLK